MLPAAMMGELGIRAAASLKSARQSNPSADVAQRVVAPRVLRRGAGFIAGGSTLCSAIRLIPRSKPRKFVAHRHLAGKHVSPRRCDDFRPSSRRSTTPANASEMALLR